MAHWHSRANELFLRAAEFPSPHARASFLDAQCGNDAELRKQVEALLAVKDQAENPQNFVETDVAAHVPAGAAIPTLELSQTAALDAAKSPPAPLLADRYQLLEKIDEGGMGSVWLAEQKAPVKRKVAVKLIKAGMDSRQVLARFDAERQALAVMDHPNIAKVFDGGVTGEGRPFFVMEFVKGVPVTEYCDQHKLTPRERLELFLPICEAIQHAHQKGVIHRDIKPSNILVARINDQPVPKVIDFGLAKAMGPSLTDMTVHTGLGVVVGTVEYMSPEQATNSLDVDTRSDVYSLGVLLYELLTGSPPFSRSDFVTRGMMELLRFVREEEPPRPSTKLSSSDALPRLSANRRTDAKSLTVMLRNELDWVVMKAIEKDRSRRYDTASNFAADINRYLNGEAILAHPPSANYRFYKFAKKHRGRFITASVVVAMLVLGVIGTSLGLIRAEEQRKRAQAAEEATLEDFQATTGEALGKLLSAKDKFGKHDQEFLEALLARWEKFAQRQGTDEHSRRIKALGTYRVGHLLMEFGRTPEAKDRVGTAKDMFAALAKDYPLGGKYKNNTGEADHTLAVIFGRLGKPKEARACGESAHQAFKELCEMYPTVINYQFGLANTLNSLALSDNSLTLSEKHYREAIAVAESILAKEPNNPTALQRAAQSKGNLAFTLSQMKRMPEAEQEHRQSQRIWTQLLNSEPDSLERLSTLAQSHLNFSVFLIDVQQFEEAVSQCKSGLARIEPIAREYPASHGFQVIEALLCTNLGNSLYRQQKDEESLPWQTRAIEILERVRKLDPKAPDAGHHDLAIAYTNRALALEQLKQIEPAIDDFRAAIKYGDQNARSGPKAQLAYILMTATDSIDEPLALAEELTKQKDWSAEQQYNFACIYSKASAKVPDKRQTLADQAMVHLRTALERGFSQFDHIAADPDLDPIRNREDFQALIKERSAANLKPADK